MPTLKEIAKLAGLTKMGVYNRVKAIEKASPDFAHKHITVDVNRNNTIEVDDEGVDIIEAYANQHNSHKQSNVNNSTKKQESYDTSNSASNNTSSASRLAVLKIQIDSLKSLIKSKDDNIRGKDQDIHDKKMELANVHRDLANTQQLLKREQDLGVTRSHRYEERIKSLSSKIKQLPSAKSSNDKGHKKSFWQRIFGN